MMQNGNERHVIAHIFLFFQAIDCDNSSNRLSFTVFSLFPPALPKERRPNGHMQSNSQRLCVNLMHFAGKKTHFTFDDLHVPS